MIDPKDLNNRFMYHKPTAAKIGGLEAVFVNCCVPEFVNCCVPDGREKALAITHLEDAMWVGSRKRR
jgi:hypothetical protein